MRALPLLVFGLSTFGSIQARASEAAFSADGKTLRVLSTQAPVLLSFKLGDPTPVKTPLPKEMAGEDGASALLADPQGLLVAGGGKLWLWNPADPKVGPKAVAPLPPQFYVGGISRAEGKGIAGMIMLSGFHSVDPKKPLPKDVYAETTLYGMKPGGKGFLSVFVRRLRTITACPAFGGERMVFGGDNDLWEGGLEVEEDLTERAGSLWGHRSAPLAMANTDSGNSGGMGVRSVVIAGSNVWAALGGHLMGALVSVPLSAKPAVEDHPDLAESWKVQHDQLALAKAVQLPPAQGEQPSDIIESVDALCAWNSPNGEWKVAFRADHKTFWLLEKGAKEPKRIGSELPREGN